MGEIGYLDLLEKIANNEIITTNLVIKDDVGRHWKYQNNIKSFVSGMHQFLGFPSLPRNPISLPFSSCWPTHSLPLSGPDIISISVTYL